MPVALELMGRGPSRPDLLEDLVVDESALAAALARWGVGPPEVVGERGGALPSPEQVAEVLSAGRPAVVDPSPGLAPRAPEAHAHAVADLVVVATHAGVGPGHGLVPRCTTAREVWQVLGGAVAAITGGDVTAALAAADPEAVLRLGRSAREAVRDVVTCVAVPSALVGQVEADLEAAAGGRAGGRPVAGADG